MIVARRIEKIPPPGSSERFFFTVESITTISPRGVTPPPGGAAAGERDVAQDDEAGAVLTQKSLLEARLAQRVPAAVQRQRHRRLADRVTGPARAQEDVAPQRDRRDARVRPGRPQLPLGRDGDRRAPKQRVLVVDPHTTPRAGHDRIIGTTDPKTPLLNTVKPRHHPRQQPHHHPAASRKVRLLAEAARDAIAARPNTTLIHTHQPPTHPTTRAAHIKTEHPARTRIPDRRHPTTHRPHDPAPDTNRRTIARPRARRRRRRRHRRRLIARARNRREHRQQQTRHQDDAQVPATARPQTVKEPSERVGPTATNARSGSSMQMDHFPVERRMYVLSGEHQSRRGECFA
jgi:hypothetical protein